MNIFFPRQKFSATIRGCKKMPSCADTFGFEFPIKRENPLKTIRKNLCGRSNVALSAGDDSDNIVGEQNFFFARAFTLALHRCEMWKVIDWRNFRNRRETHTHITVTGKFTHVSDHTMQVFLCAQCVRRVNISKTQNR